jgi:hypothetical protein
MEARSLGGASGGKVVAVPSTAGAGGSVRFAFQLDHAAKIFPWARVRTPSTAADVFYYRVDSGPVRTWTVPVHTSLAWERIQAEPITLAAGAHTLRIFRGETGTSLDRVLLTANPVFEPIADTYQAEAFGRVPPMQEGVMGSSPLSQTRYVWVPNGAGPGGSAIIDTPVEREAHYSVWARVNAPSTADNSFGVRAGFDPAVTWDTPVTSATSWTWSQVPSLLVIQPSLAWVTFEQREDGTRLDKIVVTNDPGFRPSDDGTIVQTPIPGNAP